MGGRGGMAATDAAVADAASAEPSGAGGQAGAPVGGCGTSAIPREGLMLWLSAGAGVTQSDGAISAWADQSGAMRSATQTTAMARPQLVANALNGRPVVRFDGSKTLTMNGVKVNELTGMTIVMVNATTRLWLSDPSEWCRRASEAGCSNTYNSPLQWDETGSFGMVFLSPLQTEVVFRFGVGTGGNNGEYKPTHQRAMPIGSRFSATVAIHDGAVNRLFVNGTQVSARLNDGSLHMNVPSPAGRAAIANTRDVMTIGSGRFGNGWQGDIAEVLVYGRALPSAERQAIEQHIECAYGIL